MKPKAPDVECILTLAHAQLVEDVLYTKGCGEAHGGLPQ
jgi:hypothetical protein